MKRLLTIIVFMLTAIVAVNAQGSVTVTQSAEIDALVNGKKAAKKANKERQRVESQHESQKTSAANTSKKQDTKKLTVPKLNDHRPEISRQRYSRTTSSPCRTKLVKRLVKRPHIPTDEEIDGTYLVTKRVKKGTRRLEGFEYRLIAVVIPVLHINRLMLLDKKLRNCSLNNPSMSTSILHDGCVL